jgi:hypothetical protein
MYVAKYTFKNPFQFLENYFFMRNIWWPPSVCNQIETKSVSHSIQFPWTLCSCKLFHVLGKSHCTFCLPFPIFFIWCNMVFIDKSINDWTLDSTCWIDICNLCILLFPCGRNQQPCLWSDLYNIYVDLEKPMIWYK